VKVPKRNVLVITYFTNEDGMACSHHIDDRLPVFREMGVEPIILSSLCVPRHKEFRHFRVFSLSASGIRFELRQVFRRLAKHNPIIGHLRHVATLPIMPFYLLEKIFVSIDTTWFWKPLAVVVGKTICRRMKVDFIYSTGGPAVAHVVGEILKRKTGLPWLAEVQDPLVHDYCAKNERELRLVQQVEKQICHNADCMVFLTRAAMVETERRVADCSNGAVIYPGSSPCKVITARKANLPLQFAHFGSLGGARNLGPFLTGMELAVEENPFLLENLVVSLYGGLGKDDVERLAKSPCQTMFQYIGSLSRKQVLEKMAETDVLLLIQGVHPISTETIPSKCYEYFLSGRAILGLIHENGELEQMLKDLNHMVVPAGDPEKISDGILSLYKQVSANTMTPPHPSPYTVERAVQQLLALNEQ
jgi:hypothetical protein